MNKGPENPNNDRGKIIEAASRFIQIRQQVIQENLIKNDEIEPTGSLGSRLIERTSGASRRTNLILK